MMADRVGQQLGNYRLVRLLGRGSFAEVYLGEHLHLKSLAALKVLRTELAYEDVAKFLAEGQTLARLKHPQIVRVHDFAVEQGTPFLVMDYAPRGTLRQYYPRGSCLSLDTVVTYARHVAEALQYAHNHNVIHRDVKPENILLGTHREGLLSDFGLALFAPSPEWLSTQNLAGTLPYMAPEQLQGKPCFASDQYALGIMVYEWLCGVRPRERLRSERTSRSPSRLLAVIGPSGSGKSSVVMAGLLPRLRQSALPRSEGWVYLSPIVPGVHPLETLALTLAPHLPERSLKSIREDLEDDSARGLHLLATHLVKGTEKKVVLLVDQFEEVFNLTTMEDEREHFFNLLQTSVTEWQGPVFLILTLRADFYDRLMVSSELGRLIQQYQLVVWPMEVDELRAAIKGPTALPDVLLTFEENLVGDLLYEVRGQVGALPLLQFTLDQLFERRKDHLLTQQAYQEIGGVKGALAKRAEAIYHTRLAKGESAGACAGYMRLHLLEMQQFHQ
jgi:serine/threonine protein kinase